MGSMGRKQLSVGQRPVSESDRISILERLEEFRAGAAREMTFESDLNNHDRAVVHDFCKKMGFKSKSHGKGGERSVTVYKSGLEQVNKSVTALSISEAAQEVIGQLFTRFPPTDDEHQDDPANKRVVSACRARRPIKFRPPLGSADIARQAASLADRARKLPALQQIAKDRAKLPIAAYENIITSTMDSHQVILIAGETGCGKTTQVPQFILKHMWSQGKPCKIVCTQPRRISAISVAERIAAERGEAVGTTVGYQIRLETKGGRHTSLMFQTNGILLRKLVGNAGQSEVKEDGNNPDAQSDDLSGVDATHIIVDEIHERDRNADFLLIVLRDLLALRPDLHLILMSATLDSDLFSKYFGDCPVITVPGFTYPVRTYFLEDVLSLTEAGKVKTKTVDDSRSKDELIVDKETADAMDAAIALAWLEGDFEDLMNLVIEDPKLCNYQHPQTGASALMTAAGKGQTDDIATLLSLGADVSMVSEDGSTALHWAKIHGQMEAVSQLAKFRDLQPPSKEQVELLEKYQRNVDQEEIDVALIECLLRHICTTSSPNHSILVFLAGWEDISRVREELTKSLFFSNKSEFLLLPLHSMVPSVEQRKVFKRPPRGVRKIVLATNIAETAITIDDVVYVVDTGRVKEKSYDPYSNVSTLQTAWISKASMRQRAGRAGRCQPGESYHLFSRLRADSMADYQLPEIKRAPLEELCLQVKLLEPNGRISDFICKAIEPPLELSVKNAVLLLQDIGALTPDEKLTELGKQLGSLPVHPATSKMLLFAMLLNCLDPALTVACAGDYREPFVLPMAPREKQLAAAAKRELAAAYGGYGDHLAVVAAFHRWEQAKEVGQDQQFCSQYFISGGTMATLAGMRQQLQSELAQKGFIPRGRHPCSLNAQDPGIVRAVIAAGAYPMIGTLLAPLTSNQKIVVQTSRGQKVRIHPHSANFDLSRGNSKEIYGAILAFDEITRGERQVYIKNSTLVKPHPVVLISTEMVVVPINREVGSNISSVLADDDDDDDDEDSEDEGVPNWPSGRQDNQPMSHPENLVVVVIDRWLEFKATAVEASELFYLRQRMLAAIKHKIEQPRAPLPEKLACSVYTIACLLSFDGVLDLPPIHRPRMGLQAPQPLRTHVDANICSSNPSGTIVSSGNLRRTSQQPYRPPQHNGGGSFPPAGNGRYMRPEGRGGIRQDGMGGFRQDGRGGQANQSAGTSQNRRRKRARGTGAG